MLLWLLVLQTNRRSVIQVLSLGIVLQKFQKVGGILNEGIGVSLHVAQVDLVSRSRLTGMSEDLVCYAAVQYHNLVAVAGSGVLKEKE